MSGQDQPGSTRVRLGSGGRRLKLKDDMIGQNIGNVVIESKIATGGMAIVYLGRQEITNRQVAVKVMRPERQLSERDREYFVREGKALAQIRHPNLVELYSAGVTESGRHYMVLEFVPGQTLRQLVESDGALEPLRCLRLFRQLLLALEAAHATGIVHRDLKPDNVLIESLEGGKERLRLADLGLVKFTSKRMPKLTGHGMTVGTPCYMSPEQVRGEDLDARSDIYTVGVLMFEALTSYLPYPEEKSIDGLLDHILDTRPARLTRADKKFRRVPGIQSLLDDLMAKEADDRPHSASEVVRILEYLIKTELSQEVERGHDGWDMEDEDAPASENGSQVDGILISFATRRTLDGNVAPAPPAMLRRLRSWLEDGDICCAHRHESLTTFGMRRSEQSVRLVSGLPRLVERVSKEFPAYTLGVGVSFGPFEVSESEEPLASKTLERAHRLAKRAQDGQVLIPRNAASVFGLTPEET